MSLIQRFIEQTRSRSLFVLVVGDAILDEFHPVSVSRIAPEGVAPVLLADGEPILRPGGAANVAAQFRHLATHVHLVAPLDRETGKHFWMDGVNLHGPVYEGAHVPRKQRFLAGDHLLFRHDIESPWEGDLSELREMVWHTVRDTLKGHRIDAVILSDYGKGTFDEGLVRRIITLSREKQIPVLVDPKNRPWKWWIGATVLKLNSQEVRSFSLKHTLEVRRDIDPTTAVVITHADRSPRILDQNGMTLLPSSPPVHPRSVSGAGDCFLAWLTAALCRGLDLSQAAELAHLAGKVYVMHAHNQSVEPREVLSLLDPALGKIVALDACQGLPRPLVWTNGCFRLVVPGHCRLLQWARQQGASLVVGVNSDASVERIRGEKPPLCEQERALMLASLESVDRVVIFEEDTPEAIMQSLRPDMLIKGPDYAGKEIPGQQWCGEVRIAPDLGAREHVSDVIRRVRMDVIQ